MDAIAFDVKQYIKEFTVRDIYNAIDKNGWDHLRGMWFDEWDADGKPHAGCVLAQAAINLNVASSSEDNEDNRKDDWFDAVSVLQGNDEDWGYRLRYELNVASNYYNVHNQLNMFRVSAISPWAKPKGDSVFPTMSSLHLGDVIIHWNDSYSIIGPADEEYDEELGRGNAYSVYDLLTYDDVRKMAFELMEPFFDEKVELLVFG